MTDRQDAERRRDNIKHDLRSAGTVYAQAVLARDWEALGLTREAWHDDIMGDAKWIEAARVEIETILADAGQTYREIGKAVGVSAPTVSEDLRKAGVQPPNTSPRQQVAREREEKKREGWKVYCEHCAGMHKRGAPCSKRDSVRGSTEDNPASPDKPRTKVKPDFVTVRFRYLGKARPDWVADAVMNHFIREETAELFRMLRDYLDKPE
jgi:DNA-binding transcriptional ArsR family regulator